jgi:hypothetical protein
MARRIEEIGKMGSSRLGSSFEVFLVGLPEAARNKQKTEGGEDEK